MYQMLSRPGLLLAGFGLVLVAAPTAAMEIYKWVSGDGAIHYGESLPNGEIASFEVLEVIPVAPQSLPASNDYQSTLDMATRMQSDRLERERVRLEQEKLRQEERRARDEAQRYKDAYTSPSYFMPYYPYRPYRRPPYHGKYPGYPPSRPPQGPHPAPNMPNRVFLDR
jgi:hypothetical protein